MIVATPEETDGYGGLFDEVVTEDCYGLRSLDFVPTLVLDMGANIGVFARYARSLFPQARIVCVEPDPDNFANLTAFTPDPNTILINKAIGVGRVRHFLGAINGAHESYVSAGLGFDEGLMRGSDQIVAIGTGQSKPVTGFEFCAAPAVMPDALLAEWGKPDDRVLVKMDIEGGENVVLTHEPSMAALRRVDYLAAEIHFYALHGGVLEATKAAIMDALHSFDATHECHLDGVNFQARRRT